MQASIRSALCVFGTILCVLAIAGCSADGPQMAGAWSFDQTDIRKVVGRSSHIFVGRVVAVAGNEGIPTSGPGNVTVPFTQFTVEMLENIKGELTGTVTVNQVGGSTDLGTNVDLESDALLEVGRSYLLATGYNPEKGWYRIIAQGYGNVVIDDAEKRSREVERFQSAIEHQILPSSPEFEKTGPVPDEFKLQNASER